MALEDFLEDNLEPEVGLVVAAVAVAFSPQVRGILRRGAVYGFSGLLVASDGIAALARRIQQTIQPPPASTFIQDLAEEARAEQLKRARARTEEVHSTQIQSDTEAT